MPISNPVPRGIDDNLRARTWQVIQRGLALGLSPAKQWWNLPAKFDAVQPIRLQEEMIHPGRNNHDDAMRHAEWSRRMAEEFDPGFSQVVGIGHEITGMFPHRDPDSGGRAPGQGLSEARMDMINNTEGIRSWQEGRPIDPSKLADHPVAFRRSNRNPSGYR